MAPISVRYCFVSPHNRRRLCMMITLDGGAPVKTLMRRRDKTPRRRHFALYVPLCFLVSRAVWDRPPRSSLTFLQPMPLKLDASRSLFDAKREFLGPDATP